MFKMNSVFQWIISIGLILYVGYSTYKSVRGFVQYKKIRKRTLIRIRMRSSFSAASGSA